MLLFRSEDHIPRWLAGRAPGASIALSTLAALAIAWWGDRLDPGWRSHTREQNQRILGDLGLTGPFWELG